MIPVFDTDTDSLPATMIVRGGTDTFHDTVVSCILRFLQARVIESITGLVSVLVLAWLVGAWEGSAATRSSLG